MSLPTFTLHLIDSAATLNRRLAQRAREAGVQILAHRGTGRHYATDHRAPDELRVVTLAHTRWAPYRRTYHATLNVVMAYTVPGVVLSPA